MTDLQKYGFEPNILPENSTAIPARITAVHRERYELICEYGIIYSKLKKGVYYNEANEVFPTIGDFVLIQFNSGGDSLIIKTLQRKTYFSRRDPTPGRGEQAVAANFDYVFIMTSLNNDFNLKRLERYLTLARQSKAEPVIIFTKADLCDDYDNYLCATRKIAMNVEIIATSAVNKQGFGLLSPYLSPGKTIVFLGSSGVGKSSLINALAGENIMDVNSIREDDSKGRHTTTHRQLIMLNSGVMIIDTPGMRELGMWDISAGLSETFSDVEMYLNSCKFPDCSHVKEPGCAIKAAIENGELTFERWQNYLKLKKEAKYADNKAGALSEKAQRNKMISKFSKQNRKRFD